MDSRLASGTAALYAKEYYDDDQTRVAPGASRHPFRHEFALHGMGEDGLVRGLHCLLIQAVLLEYVPRVGYVVVHRHGLYHM